MKYQYKLLKKFVILFLCFCTSLAKAECESYAVEPVLELTIRYGEIFYDNQKSNSEFPTKPYSTTMGLTVSNFKQDMKADSVMIPQEDGFICVRLEKVYATVGFPRIDIYIDKKYRPGSCNFEVVKEHENYHARVQQEGLKFFAPKIREAFGIAVRKSKPQVASKDQAEYVANKLLSNIQSQVAPTLQFIQKRLEEENMVIDTTSSYEAEAKKCPNW